MSASTDAHATNQCPNAVSNCNNICTVSSGNFVCDVTANGTGYAAIVDAIYGNCGTHDYCVYGSDASGSTFCCSVASTGLTGLILFGSAYNDQLNFNDGTYTLTDYGGGVFEGKILGSSGNDTINGSFSTSAYYKDVLGGQGGQDTISALAGNDYCDGGDNEDTIFGGDGDDQLYGGADDDSVEGNLGADQVYGGSGDDFLSGGTGADLVIGDGGNDTICGDNDNDDLRGFDGDDILWGDGGSDIKTGGNNSDECDGNGTNYTCETITSSMARPSCPGP